MASVDPAGSGMCDVMLSGHQGPVGRVTKQLKSSGEQGRIMSSIAKACPEVTGLVIEGAV